MLDKESSIKALVIAIILACMIIFFGANHALAFYKWVDESGILHVTDSPPPGKAAPDPVAQEQEKKAAEPAPAVNEMKQSQPAAAPQQPAQPQPVAVPASMPAKVEQKAAALPPPQVPVQNAASPPIAPIAKAPVQPAASPTVVPAAPAPAPQAIPVLPQTAPVQGIMNAKQANQAAAAIVAGMFSVLMIFLLFAYMYGSLCIFLIAKKLNIQSAWMAWIPIIQVFTFLACAGKPAWWVILLLVPIVNAFLSIYLWMCIAENLGKEKWFALLMLVPVVNFIYMGALAFSKGGGGEMSPALS